MVSISIGHDHWMVQGINPLILLLGSFDFLDPATAATRVGSLVAERRPESAPQGGRIARNLPGTLLVNHGRGLRLVAALNHIQSIP